MYIVQTCMYAFIGLRTHFGLYKHVQQCTNVYIDCYGAHVECTARPVHFMKCTDIAEPGTYTVGSGTYIAEPGTYGMQLFYLPCLLACRLGLAAQAALCHA